MQFTSFYIHISIFYNLIFSFCIHISSFYILISSFPDNFQFLHPILQFLHPILQFLQPNFQFLYSYLQFLHPIFQNTKKKIFYSNFQIDPFDLAVLSPNITINATKAVQKTAVIHGAIISASGNSALKHSATSTVTEHHNILKLSQVTSRFSSLPVPSLPTKVQTIFHHFYIEISIFLQMQSIVVLNAFFTSKIY